MEYTHNLFEQDLTASRVPTPPPHGANLLVVRMLSTSLTLGLTPCNSRGIAIHHKYLHYVFVPREPLIYTLDSLRQLVCLRHHTNY